MRKLTFLLAPLFLLACDREPVAPDIAPAVSEPSPEFAAANGGWLGPFPSAERDFAPYIDEGLECLGPGPWGIHQGAGGIQFWIKPGSNSGKGISIYRIRLGDGGMEYYNNSGDAWTVTKTVAHVAWTPRGPADEGGYGTTQPYSDWLVDADGNRAKVTFLYQILGDENFNFTALKETILNCENIGG